MPGKLFIGNLSFKVSDTELNELFAGLNIAVDNIRVMRDLDTGRSRGFAFAELAPNVDMEAAIKELNGKVLDGRALTVNEARPQAKREFGGGGGGHFNRGRRPGGGGGGGGRGGNDRDRPRRKRGPDLY
jgi:RNA recognition motif-containing protein